MKRFLAVFFIALLISVLTCASVWAQATAQISGTVRDQSGAVLPGVKVTATQTDTGISRSTITNETGSYNMPNLVVGSYRLEASLPGFRAFAQTASRPRGSNESHRPEIWLVSLQSAGDHLRA